MTQIDLLQEATADGESIQFWTPDTKARLVLSSFSTIRTGGTKASLEVHWNEKPSVGLIKQGWVKFGDSVSPWARELSKVAPGEYTERDWHNIIQAATYRAQRWFAMGEPFEQLGEQEVSPTRYLVYPVVVESGPSVVAAPGGSGKSFLALSMALTVATGSARFLGVRPNRTGPVLYLDWEDDRETQDERLYALCRKQGVEPPSDKLIYQRMRAPLTDSVNALTRKIMELPERPVMVVIDSIGKARGGDVNSSELTNYLFAAIDKLQVATFCIDHKSKEAIEHNKKGAIGSIYTWNSARIMWDMEKSQAIGAPSLVTKLTCVKNNRGRLHKPLAWEVDFHVEHANTENEVLVGVEYTPMVPSTVTILTPQEQSNAEVVESVLAQADEPLAIREIEERCSLSNQAIRNAIAQHPTHFNLVSGKVKRYELAMRADQQVIDLPAPF